MMHVTVLPIWILVIIGVGVICGAKRVVCGGPTARAFSILSITFIVGFLLFLASRRASVLPSPAVITMPPFPRFVSPRITPPALHITTRPMVYQGLATQPTTQFTNLWLDDWSAFVSSTHWAGFRAESSDSCVTEAEAREQAIDSAALQLAQAAAADSSLPADGRSRETLIQNLKNGIAPRLRSGDLIADQMVRKVEKSYGTLYKSYLLIETSPTALSALNRYAHDTLSQAKTAEVTTWASTAGLFVVIILLYAFLNAATKGYFVWKLRAAALMVLIVAVLALFAWT